MIIWRWCGNFGADIHEEIGDFYSSCTASIKIIVYGQKFNLKLRDEIVWKDVCLNHQCITSYFHTTKLCRHCQYYFINLSRQVSSDFQPILFSPEMMVDMKEFCSFICSQEWMLCNLFVQQKNQLKNRHWM